ILADLPRPHSLSIAHADERAIPVERRRRSAALLYPGRDLVDADVFGRTRAEILAQHLRLPVVVAHDEVVLAGMLKRTVDQLPEALALALAVLEILTPPDVRPFRVLKYAADLRPGLPLGHGQEAIGLGNVVQLG